MATPLTLTTAVTPGFPGVKVTSMAQSKIYTFTLTSSGSGTGTYTSPSFSLPQHRRVGIAYYTSATFTNTIIIAMELSPDFGTTWLTFTEPSGSANDWCIGSSSGFANSSTSGNSDNLNTSVFQAPLYRFTVTNSAALDGGVSLNIYFDIED